MQNIIKLFKNRYLTASVIIFSLFCSALTVLPNRRQILDFWSGDGNSAYFTEIIFNLIILLIYSIFSGYITYLIINQTLDHRIGLVDSIIDIKKWFLRSLIVFFIGWRGFFAINYLVNQVSSDSVHSFLSLFIGGLWITFTFIFYPTVIASKKSVFISIIESFSIGVRSINRWFHLLLLLFFISGGLTFLWIPEYWANRFWGINHDYSGWMTHLQWLGGYSFQNYWYSDLTKWLFINPPAIVNVLVILFNILIATLIKIKVVRILFENGYLPIQDEN